MTDSRLTVCAAILLMATHFTSVTLAQESPFLRGRVSEITGLPVADVVVTRRNISTGATDTTTTNPEGRFAFDNLTPGTYQLTFVKAGFEPVVRDAITVADRGESARRTVDVVLERGRVNELVTVVGPAPRVVPSTAAKLDLPAREVPVTVSTVSSRTLQEQGTDTLAAAVRNVSGASAFVRYGAYQSFTVRGFNTEGGTANLMVLIDGVPREGGRIASQLTNIERIEVLKGPASVLYGGEALAGAMNLIRKQPSSTPGYEFSVAAGSFNTYRSSFSATGTLGSRKLLYRFDAGVENADNWRDAGTRRVNVTPSMYWAPTSTDRVTAHVSVDRDDFDTDPGIPLVNGRDFPNVPLSRRYNTPQDFAHSRDRNLQLRYARMFGDSVDVRNVTSYRRYDIDYLSAETVGVTPPSTVNRELLYFNDHVRPFVNQTEVQGRFRLFGLENRLLGGWEFQRFNSSSDDSTTASIVTTPIDLFNPVETHVPVPIVITGIVLFRNTINALYVQDHLSLSDNVKLLLGGRADFFRRWSRNDTIVDGRSLSDPVAHRAADVVSPRVGMVYLVNSASSFYGSYATSFSPVNTIPHDGRNLEPQRGRQFEAGHRLEILNQRVNVTTAFYNLTRRNVPITIASSPTGPIIEQAGEQRSRGIEVDVIAGGLSDRWRVNANYGFADSAYLEFHSRGMDLAGRKTAFAPRHTANVWATRTLTSGIGVGMGGRFVGARFSNFFNDVPLPITRRWTRRCSIGGTPGICR